MKVNIVKVEGLKEAFPNFAIPKKISAQKFLNAIGEIIGPVKLEKATFSLFEKKDAQAKKIQALFEKNGILSSEDQFHFLEHIVESCN